MRKKHHPDHVRIAKALGTTPAQLLALLNVKAGRSALNCGHFLRAKGLVQLDNTSAYPYYRLSYAGIDLIERARKMGL